jgi:hypothetical protein
MGMMDEGGLGGREGVGGGVEVERLEAGGW